MIINKTIIIFFNTYFSVILYLFIEESNQIFSRLQKLSNNFAPNKLADISIGIHSFTKFSKYHYGNFEKVYTQQLDILYSHTSESISMNFV